MVTSISQRDCLLQTRQPGRRCTEHPDSFNFLIGIVGATSTTSSTRSRYAWCEPLTHYHTSHLFRRLPRAPHRTTSYDVPEHYTKRDISSTNISDQAAHASYSSGSSQQGLEVSATERRHDTRLDVRSRLPPAWTLRTRRRDHGCAAERQATSSLPRVPAFLPIIHVPEM